MKPSHAPSYDGIARGYEQPPIAQMLMRLQGFFQTVLVQATGNYAVKKECMDSKDMKQMVFEKVLTQMTAKAGTRLYGDEAVQALMQEFAQLEGLGVFLAKSANKLTREQKIEALRAINLIMKKRDGRIKCRTVVDGSVQRDFYEKSPTASPTVSTDALLISLIIDAQDVAVAHVVAEYLRLT